MQPTLQPVTLQKIGNEFAIAWSDGTESYLALETLRRHCPCAACCGEPDVTGHVDLPKPPEFTPASFDLKGWRLVGGYAIEPHWNDGHRSGLYSYPHLRKLAAQD